MDDSGYLAIGGDIYNTEHCRMIITVHGSFALDPYAVVAQDDKRRGGLG
ncbi:hypothetical protein [Cysteiniphilum sp. 19S12-1]